MKSFNEQLGLQHEMLWVQNYGVYNVFLDCKSDWLSRPKCFTVRLPVSVHTNT